MNKIQIKRHLGGTGAPGTGNALEGEIALAFPMAAGGTGIAATPQLWAFDGSGWLLVNPPPSTITTKSIDLNNPGGANLGAAYNAWAAVPGNALSGDIIIASYGTPAQAYVLTDKAHPGQTASWTSLGGAVAFADATEIHAGTDTTKAINSAILRGEALNAPSVAGGVADADRLIRLDANGKIAAAFLPVSSLRQLGAKDVTAGLGAYTPTTGDSFFVSVTGTANAGWTGIGGQAVKAGDMVIYDGTNFHLVPNETDLNAYLKLAGGTMEDGAVITFDTTTGGAGTVVLNGDSGALDNFVIDGGTF
jgi:hypothetical protein